MRLAFAHGRTLSASPLGVCEGARDTQGPESIDVIHPDVLDTFRRELEDFSHSEYQTEGILSQIVSLTQVDDAGREAAQYVTVLPAETKTRLRDYLEMIVNAKALARRLGGPVSEEEQAVFQERARALLAALNDLGA
jgi:hypothetical protein